MDFSIVLGKELDIKLLGPQLALRVAIGLHLGEGQHEGVNPVLEVVCEVLHCVSQSAARAIINVLPCAAKLLTILAQLSSRSSIFSQLLLNVRTMGFHNVYIIAWQYLNSSLVM